MTVYVILGLISQSFMAASNVEPGPSGPATCISQRPLRLTSRRFRGSARKSNTSSTSRWIMTVAFAFTRLCSLVSRLRVLRIARHQNVLSQALDGDVPEAERVGHAVGTLAGDGRGGVGCADDQGGDDGVDVIDERAVEEAAEEDATAFDECSEDIVARQVAEERLQVEVVAGAGEDDDFGALGLDRRAPGGRRVARCCDERARWAGKDARHRRDTAAAVDNDSQGLARSEEHTSELQSLAYLVCRLL